MADPSIQPHTVDLAVVLRDGYGMQRSDLALLHRSTPIVAMVDPDGVVPTTLRRELGHVGIFATLPELLTAHKPHMLLITSPHGIQDAVVAARQSVHAIFAHHCAAPWEQLSALSQLAQSSGAYITSADTLRRHGGYRALERLVVGGGLGGALQVQCSVTCAPEPGNNQTDGEWRAAFVGAACRSIDLCRWLLGEVEAVSADTGAVTGRVIAGYLANMILTHQRGISIHHITGATNNHVAEHYHCDTSLGVLEIDAKNAVGDYSQVIAGARVNWRGSSVANVMVDDLRAALAQPMSLQDAVMAACREATGLLVDERDAYVKLSEVISAATLAAMEGAKINMPLAMRPKQRRSLVRR